LPPCRMQVLPPAWCRRCRGGAACCRSRSLLAITSHLQSRRRSLIMDEAAPFCRAEFVHPHRLCAAACERADPLAFTQRDDAAY
jgi:hypothetical protein